MGGKWLFETFYSESAFVTSDSDEARNPQRFIHVTVIGHCPHRFDYQLNP